MSQDVIDAEGEVVAVSDPGSSLAVGLSRAEIDTQIATAHRFPRSPQTVQRRVMDMATLDEESAQECIYALPRGGKPIQGPSVRFAEILKQSYGNCRAAARVVHVDRQEKYVEAEGIFHDLETNTATSARVRRRIVDSKGRLFSDDMIVVTGNAACAIALRNAILAGVPKPLWRKAFDAVQRTIAGEHKTLAEGRQKAVAAFANFGVTPDQVYRALGVKGEADITADHLVTLRGMFSALKNNEATVQEMFSGTVAGGGSAHEPVADPLADPKEPPKKGKPKTLVELGWSLHDTLLQAENLDQATTMQDAWSARHGKEADALSDENRGKLHSLVAAHERILETGELPDDGYDAMAAEILGAGRPS